MLHDKCFLQHVDIIRTVDDRSNSTALEEKCNSDKLIFACVRPFWHSSSAVDLRFCTFCFSAANVSNHVLLFALKNIAVYIKHYCNCTVECIASSYRSIFYTFTIWLAQAWRWQQYGVFCLKQQQTGQEQFSSTLRTEMRRRKKRRRRVQQSSLTENQIDDNDLATTFRYRTPITIIKSSSNVTVNTTRRFSFFSMARFFLFFIFLLFSGGSQQIRQASAAMSITQTLRYLRNFGYLYDSINHKDFGFNGSPMMPAQPVNMRHHAGHHRRKTSAALQLHESSKNNASTWQHYDSDSISSAIRRFQAFSGLHMTGKIDAATLKQLRKPRCGNIDLQPQRAENYLPRRVAGMPANYILQGSKWDRTDLTFKIGQYSRTLSRKAVDEVIGEAFSYWGNASKLTFRQVHFGPADIIILFAKGEHGDLSPFDGPQGVLAHAFFPDFGGDTHFDDAERWTHGRKRGVNLLQVAVHELGHALGLDHSDVSAAVMAPFYDGFNSKFQLHADDIKGIRRLYGPPQEIAVVTAGKTLTKPTSSTSAPVTGARANTTTTTTKPISNNTTMMPVDELTPHQVDDKMLPTLDEISSTQSAHISDIVTVTTPTLDLTVTTSTPQLTPTSTPALALPKKTTLDTTWWWPSAEKNKTLSLKSTIEKTSTGKPDEQNNTIPFFGTPFDDVWSTSSNTVKGKRLQSSKNNSRKSIAEHFNSTTTPTPISPSPPDEWNLFSFEDLKLHSSGNDKKFTTTTISPPIPTSIPDVVVNTNNETSFNINLCDPAFRIDAVTTIDGVGYMFAGDAYWRVSALGEVLQPARSIAIDWHGLPSHIDAALSPTWAQGRTYFFKANQYWRVNHGESTTESGTGSQRRSFFVEDGYPKLIHSGWAGVPDNVESAFQWGRSTRTYFTKGNEIWSFDRTQVPPVRGPKTMPIERGFPARVDAAFRSPSGRTYLFAGDKYYAMSTWSFLISRYYPQLTSERWFGCRPATPSPYDTNNDFVDNTTAIVTPYASDIAQIHYGSSADDANNVTTNVVYVDAATSAPTESTNHWIHSRADPGSPSVKVVPTEIGVSSTATHNRGGGEFSWHSSSSRNRNAQYINALDALMTAAMAAEAAQQHTDSLNISFISPTTYIIPSEAAALLMSAAETNSVALASRRVASSFGARQFHRFHPNYQRGKRSTQSSSISDSVVNAANKSSHDITGGSNSRKSVFYFRRQKKLFPLP